MPHGTPRADFVLNRPEAAAPRSWSPDATSAAAPRASTRPWALLDFGFRAVISTEIADIFRSNALKNGLLPVIVEEPISAWLLANPGAEVTIDLAARTLTLPTGSRTGFPLEAFAQHCLLEGVDELGYLLAACQGRSRPSSAAHEGADRGPRRAMASVRRSWPRAVRCLRALARRFGHDFELDRA